MCRDGILKSTDWKDQEMLMEELYDLYRITFPASMCIYVVAYSRFFFSIVKFVNKLLKSGMSIAEATSDLYLSEVNMLTSINFTWSNL